MDPSSHTRDCKLLIQALLRRRQEVVRDSISTLDSGFSNTAASSIFSIARSNSPTSTNTAYSEHSLASASSKSSFDLTSQLPPRSTADSRATTCAPYRTASGRIHDDPQRAALPAAIQQATLRDAPPVPPPAASIATHATSIGDRQVNKLNNKFACSHCPEVFSKKSDRRKHWQMRCPYLGDLNTPEASPGDGFVCPTCDHVARNRFQQRKHQQVSGHHDSWEHIHLSARRRFTCSKHGKIWRSAGGFYAHFDHRDGCSLNQHSGGKEGYRHHQTRIITLLQEGRDDLHGNHAYLFAALSAYCDTHGLHEHDWRGIVQRHSADDALALANKLECGLQRADGSAISRLGFTDLSEMVARAVPLDHAFDRALIPDDNENGPRLPSYQTVASVPLLDTAERLTSELSNARFVRRIEENAAQAALFRAPSLAESQAGIRDQQHRIGLAMLQPLSRSGSAPLESPYYHTGSDVRHELLGRDQRAGSEAPWLHDYGTRTYQRDGLAMTARHGKEMAVRHNAPSVFLPRSMYVDSPHNADLYQSHPIITVDEYPERAALTPSPPPPSLLLARKKRPISQNSAVLADSVTRSKFGPMQRLVHRPAPTDVLADESSMAYAVGPMSSKRGSGESISNWFDFKAYEEMPSPTMLLPGTKAASYDDPVMVDARPSRTPGQSIKDKYHKMTDPTPREMDAEAAQKLTPIPRNSASASKCVHCGEFGDIGCLTKHIGGQVVPRSRRQASVLDPAEVEQAFRKIDREHSLWGFFSEDSPSFV